MYTTKIDDLRKHLKQTWHDFEQRVPVLDADVTEIMCRVYVSVAGTLNTCCEMNVQTCNSPKHFMKLSM